MRKLILETTIEQIETAIAEEARIIDKLMEDNSTRDSSAGKPEIRAALDRISALNALLPPALQVRMTPNYTRDTHCQYVERGGYDIVQTAGTADNHPPWA